MPFPPCRSRVISGQMGAGSRHPGCGAAAAPGRDLWRQHGGASGRRPEPRCAGWRKYETTAILCVPGLRQHSDVQLRRAALLLRPEAGAAAGCPRGCGARRDCAGGGDGLVCDLPPPHGEGALYPLCPACVAPDRLLLVRLYPEQGSEVRLPQLRGGGKLYLCCSRHGLFEVKLP